MEKISFNKVVLIGSKTLTVMAIFFLILFVFGCAKYSESIVEKIATGQELTVMEQKTYTKHKESFDKKIALRKKEIEESSYKPATTEEIAAGERVYKTKSGEKAIFNISKSECEKFGFQAGDRVETPNGRGYVIGVCEKSIWFHLDKDPGASYWENYKNDDYVKDGFKIIEEAKPYAGRRTAPAVETDSTESVPAKSVTDIPGSSSKIDNDEEADVSTGGIYVKPIKRIPYLKKEK